MQARITAALAAQTSPSGKPVEIFDTEIRGLILRVEPSGSKSFYCAYRIRPSGKRGRYKIGRFPATSPAAARDEARKIQGDAARGIDPMLAVREARKVAQSHTLESFIREVYAPWAAPHYSDAEETIGRLLVSFRSVLKHRLTDLNQLQLERWKADRQQTPGKHQRRLSPATINRDLSDLRAALNRAVEWGHLDSSPLSRVKPLKVPDEPLVRYLRDHEEQALLRELTARDAAARAARERTNTWRIARHLDPLPALAGQYSDHLTPMVLLSINTGLRRGELFQLRWADIDQERRSLTVRAGNAKSRKVRHIPLNDDAYAALESWRAQSPSIAGLVFPAEDGGPFENVDSSYYRVLDKAGIRPFRWHDLRHHFASRLVMEGVDLNTVRELLGHADIKMTLRYAHLAPEHKARAVAKLRRFA